MAGEAIIISVLREILDELKELRKDMKAQRAVDICQDPSWSDLSFPISVDGFQTKHNY